MRRGHGSGAHAAGDLAPAESGPGVGTDTAALAEDIAAWLPRQRWFAGKARSVAGVAVADFASLGSRLVLVLAEVVYDDGERERYQVPLAVQQDRGQWQGEVVTHAGGLDFVDALRDDQACSRLAALARSPEPVPTAGGAALTGEPHGELTLPSRVRSLGVEQSNSSVVLGDDVLLKLYRRVEPGDNPEVELTRALTEAGSAHVPAVRGVLSLREPGGDVTTLAVVGDFVSGGREGWALATREAAARAGGQQPPAGGGLAAGVRDLGVALAEVHGLLGQQLGARPATARDTARWRDAAGAQLDRVFDLARRRAPDAAAAVLDRRADVRRALEAFGAQADPGVLVRIHGDLHLGQVMLDRDGRWQLLDFEGEPSRGLAERREPGSPLRDVAGMLRSFDYVVGHAVLAGADEQSLAGWRDELRAAFLAGYLPAARDAAVLPAESASVTALLDAFELDKAVYELGYELANRPDWVGIPAGGILRVLAHAAQQRKEGPSMTPSSRLPHAAPTGEAGGQQPSGADPERPTEQPAPQEIGAEPEAAGADPERSTEQPGPQEAGAEPEAAGADPERSTERPGPQEAGAEPEAAEQPAVPEHEAAAVDDAALLPTAGPESRAPGPTPWKADPREVAALLEGRHADPHRLLGVHPHGDGTVVRAYRPDAESVTIVLLDGGETVVAERTHPAGFFEARLDRQPLASGYRLRTRYARGEFELWDAYAFWPTLGEVDLHLAGEGSHEELWRRMGAHVGTHEGVTGTSFAVWAPHAASVRVVGDWNSWDGRLHPMRRLGSSGIWELFVPDVGSGAHYKYEIVTAQGHLVTRADPFAFATEQPPGTASRVYDSRYTWGDQGWMEGRGGDSLTSAMSVYEVHLGSWRHTDGRPLSYRELADQLIGHVTYLGFSHVEFLPVAEHPFGGSWGYQVTGYFAPTARYGTPDDFRYLVDRLHQAGIGVIVDWVPAHFPRDEWALARFDGTALYEHADPRQGEHPDWGTLVFNFGRNEVRNFLIANALYWLEELHVDGLRVDAVASMLYLDYSREEGQWIPNRFGGRENLEAVEFLKELNRTVYGRNPNAMVIAEESTAWPGVSRPVHLGGLGFGLKWNMGWMHDTLSYFSTDSIYRRYHHQQLTFSLMYAFSENFILPFSHDEVVHGKRSMLDKMPGDRWQKFANLRALYAYMWAHPGKQLLFMGSEFGQWREWSESRELDWHLLDEPDHQGLQALVADLNARYRELPALWQRDSDPLGFTWIDANNADDNVASFIRWGEPGSAPVVCVCNFSPIVRRTRVGLPEIGTYREVLNTDAAGYGGGNIGNLGEVRADPHGWQGQPASGEVTLPPLGVVWLSKG